MQNGKYKYVKNSHIPTKKEKKKIRQGTDFFFKHHCSPEFKKLLISTQDQSSLDLRCGLSINDKCFFFSITSKTFSVHGFIV